MLDINELQHKSREELVEMLVDIEQTCQEKESQIEAQHKEIQSKKQSIEQLTELYLILKHNRFGSSSERYAPSSIQYGLFDEAVMPESAEEIETAEAEIIVPEHTRKKRGRKALPEALPRVEVIHDLQEHEKTCGCGNLLTHIKDVITEQLDIVPAVVQVIRHIQKQYACRACDETMKLSSKPKQVIPKGMATEGTLAFVLTQKFQYHLPLYRQEQMLQALGVDIPRATLSLWVIKCAQALQPLVNLLEDEILGYDVAYADETTVQVLKEANKRAQSKSYMWSFAGGPPDRRSYVYHYHPSREYQKAIDFFVDYQGYLHCDGYQAYDRVAKQNPGIIQVGCWYHCRRKFKDAAKVSKKAALADYFLKQIQKLSKIEKYLKHTAMSYDEIAAYREEHSNPIIDKIHDKLIENKDKVSPTIALGKAIHYTLNQWPKLLTYLTDGRLDISNNRMERAIKPFAVGRKNWMFNNSVQGAKAAAIIYSLMETCKAHDVNPYQWLRHTLQHIPNAQTVEDYEKLLPFHFFKSQHKRQQS